MLNTIVLVATTTFFFFNFLFAQTAGLQPFPDIKAKTLEEKEVLLPENANKEVNIIFLLFEQNAQLHVNTWAEVILEKYEPKMNVSYYEVPMMSGFYRFMSGQINQWMRDGIPEEYHDNTACFYGNRNPVFEALNITDKSSAYLFVLDQKGFIHFRTEGSRSDQKESALRVAIQTLLSSAGQ